MENQTNTKDKRDILLNKIKNNKTKAVFVGIVMFLMIISGYLTDKQKSISVGKPSDNKPDISPGASQNDYLPKPYIYPNSVEVSNAGLRSSITLSFDENVYGHTVLVSSKPQVDFKIIIRDIDRSTVLLEPSTPWVEGTKYEIVVAKGVTSISGTKTNDNIVITFTSTKVEDPDYSSSGDSHGI